MPNSELLAILFTLHLLFVVIWVGGMFFAYMALRPVASSLLEPPLRQQLWADTFARFFPWVWAAVILLLVSGLWLIRIYGGMGVVGLHIHLMFGLGLLMMGLFLHLFFAPYRRLKQAIQAEDWSNGGRQLNQIRLIIAINLALGLITICVASYGKYSAFF